LQLHDSTYPFAGHGHLQILERPYLFSLAHLVSQALPPNALSAREGPIWDGTGTDFGYAIEDPPNVAIWKMTARDTAICTPACRTFECKLIKSRRGFCGAAELETDDVATPNPHGWLLQSGRCHRGTRAYAQGVRLWRGGKPASSDFM
jgi:hypothetical protein